MLASVLFALVLVSPFVVWQAWAFVAAGLYRHEQRLFYRYFPFMVALFASGVAFGYRIVLPFSLGFLISLMNPDQVGAMLAVGQYFTLLFWLTAAMGLMFQLPLVMLALQRVRPRDPQGLPQALADHAADHLHRGRDLHAAGADLDAADGDADGDPLRARSAPDLLRPEG